MRAGSFGIAIAAAVGFASAASIVIHTTNATNVVSAKFVSVTLDASGFERGWPEVRPFDDPRLIHLAQGLSPGHLRVGGTAADYLYYDLPSSSAVPADQAAVSDRVPDVVNQTMWDGVASLAKAAGWTWVFGVSGLNRTADDKWNPSSARGLLEYAKAQGILSGYELHNEEDLDDSHNKTSFKITPATTAQDFLAMRALMKDVYGQDGPPTPGSSGPSRPMLIGSDVADDLSFLGDFASDLVAGSPKDSGPALSALTWHHYYGAGPSMRVSDFVKAKTLDSVRHDILQAQAIAQGMPPGTEPWIGETGSSYHGGTPGVSDRFVSIFWWADQLAYAALHGHGAVCRQAFIGGAYTLVDPQPSLFPNADYWLGVLFKRLVGGGQLAVDGQEASGLTLRPYAACARRAGTADAEGVMGARAYPAGAVTAVLINIDDTPKNVTLSMPSQRQAVDATPWEAFTLTAPGGNLSSKAIELNGQVLSVAADGSLPPLDGAAVAPGPQALPAYSVTFLVVTDAGAQACQ